MVIGERLRAPNLGPWRWLGGSLVAPAANWRGVHYRKMRQTAVDLVFVLKMTK